MNWIDTLLGLTGVQWVVVGLMGSSLAWFVVLVWFKRTKLKPQ